MAKVAITEQYLEDIADAIREKTGLSDTFYPSEMAPAILTISGSGGIIPTGTINIIENGTYNVTQYASADVTVPTGSTINNQNKTVSPSTSQQAVTFDSGYTGLGMVTVNAIQTETKSATPSETAQTITPSSGKYLTSVSVGAIASDYVGSGVTRNTSSDLSVSGATVTVSSGFYEDGASASVTTTTHPKPTASINSTTGLVTASHTQTTGYVTGGTTTGTLQLTTQAAKTVTPSTSSQTAVAAGRYTTGAVSVSAVPTEEKTVTTNGEVTPSSGKFLSKVTVNVPTGSTINNQNKNVTPTESSQEVTADSGYTGLGTVTVGAISSTYVGSNIAQRSSTNLSVSGATVTAPAGYYAESASKSVVSGTAGTPSATKGTVSNHAISVTPSVTNTTGYITGSTKTGTAVTVSASELVSGTKSITENGTGIDVTNYASIDVAVQSGEDIPSFIVNTSTSPVSVTCNKTYAECRTLYENGNASSIATILPNNLKLTAGVCEYESSYILYCLYNNLGYPIADISYTASGITYIESSSRNGVQGTPIAKKGTVSNHSVSVTPSVTNSAGYITGGTKTGTAISVSASELVSGTLSVTSNGTKDVTNYASISVAVPTGSTINNQDKTATPTESEQEITYDDGYTGLGTVTVGAISSTYVGSGITQRDSDDLTVSGATVTVPSGYYSAQASKSINSGSLNYSGWTETETETSLTMTMNKNFIAGYLSSAPNVSRTFTNVIDTTITPSISQQTINRPNGNTFIKQVIVEAMPSGTAGTPTASKGTVTNHAISITPSVTNTTGYITGSTKTGTAVTVSASELVSGSETKTSNGTYDVTNLAELVVNVSSPSPTIQSLSVTPSTSEQTFNASSVDGYKPVTVAAMPTMTLPTSATTSPTSGYTSKATIGRSTNDQIINIPPGYNSAGAYYRVSAIANGSATAPASISGTSASISTGTNTLTLTKTVSVTPSVTAGYVSSGTAGNSSVSLTASIPINPTPTASGATVTIPTGYYSSQTTKSVSSGSASAPTSISGTTATVSTGTNTLTLTKTVSVTPVVSAGYVSSGTATNSTVSLTAAVTTKAATTYNTSTSNQTIAAGTYLTGAQTIRAVTTSNLSAANVASGVTITVGDSADADRIASVTGTFTSDATATAADIIGGATAYINGNKVSGTMVAQKYYTGSSAPSSSLGNNGDIYIQA